MQLPPETDETEVSAAIYEIAQSMYLQHKSIILAVPEIFGIKGTKESQWRYLRIKFKLWPGQTKILEETFQERVAQLLKKYSEDYSAWMITITYKVE